MERFVSGDIIVLDFPFSDLTNIKKRPSLVLKKIAGKDLILAQITGKSFHKSEEVIIKNEDFLKSGLSRISYVRFTKLFTADESLIKYKIGSLKQEKFNDVIDEICSFLKD